MKSKPGKKQAVLNLLGWIGALALFVVGLTAVLKITPKSKSIPVSGNNTPAAKP